MSGTAPQSCAARSGGSRVAATLEHLAVSLRDSGNLAASCAFMMPVATPPNAIVSTRAITGFLACTGLGVNSLSLHRALCADSRPLAG
jgi:hypothetical protein